MVYYLYERATRIKLDYRLVGSKLFHKYQYVFLERFGKMVVNFESTVKQAVEVIGEDIDEEDVPIIFKIEYLSERGLMMVWIEPKMDEEVEGGMNEEELLKYYDLIPPQRPVEQGGYQSFSDEDENDDGDDEENEED